MSLRKVRVRELAGWDLDENEYRPHSFDRKKADRARSLVGSRAPFQADNAVLEAGDAELRDMLAQQAARPDLHAEMEGLEWSVGIVDLRLLLAFQRRLTLNPNTLGNAVPAADDWLALINLCFGGAQPIACEMVQSDTSILFRSSNPNLHFRITGDKSSPIAIHSGSPFFEVAQYRGRWFLRDGYHRAFASLTAGVFRLPAVIVHARTLDELGAVRPWFFAEEVLFSPSPPRVMDFLDDALVLEYDRAPLVKTLRITMEETYALKGEDQ